MAKKEKIAFLMPKEQIQLDKFLTVETSGKCLSSPEPFFRSSLTIDR